MNSMMRRPVKDTADNQRRWRDKFKQECTDRMKNARRDKMNKVREEQVCIYKLYFVKQGSHLFCMISGCKRH